MLLPGLMTAPFSTQQPLDRYPLPGKTLAPPSHVVNIPNFFKRVLQSTWRIDLSPSLHELRNETTLHVT
jgi:hypothetical protein